MKTSVLTLIVRSIYLLFAAVIFIKCGSGKITIENVDGLYKSLANNVSIPFNNSDTVVFRLNMAFDGCSSNEEIERTFFPRIDTGDYQSILIEKMEAPIEVVDNKKYQLILDEFRANPDSSFAWNYYAKNKTIYSVAGKIIHSDEVMIYERYRTFHETFYIDKQYNCDKHGNWTFIINKEGKLEKNTQ